MLRRLLTNPWSMFLLRMLAIFRARLSSSIQKLFDLCVPRMSSSIFVVTTQLSCWRSARCNLKSFTCQILLCWYRCCLLRCQLVPRILIPASTHSPLVLMCVAAFTGPAVT